MGLPIGNTYKLVNHKFIEIYMQFGDSLQSCQALWDDQEGYWTGNGHIDRTVEAPIKPSGRLVSATFYLSTAHPSILYLATICTYHLKIPRGLPICFASASSCHWLTTARLHGISLTMAYI